MGLSVGGMFALKTGIRPMYATIEVTKTNNLLIFYPSLPVGIPNAAKFTKEMKIKGKMTVRKVTVGCLKSVIET